MPICAGGGGWHVWWALFMRSDKCFVSSFASSHFFRISVLLFFGAESDFWRKISVRRCLIPYDNVPNAIDMTWSALFGAVDRKKEEGGHIFDALHARQSVNQLTTGWALETVQEFL